MMIDDIVSMLDRDVPRAPHKPSGLHRHGTDKWRRQASRYCWILGEIRAGDGSHYSEAVGLAEQLGRDLETDIKDRRLDPGEITRAAAEKLIARKNGNGHGHA